MSGRPAASRRYSVAILVALILCYLFFYSIVVKDVGEPPSDSLAAKKDTIKAADAWEWEAERDRNKHTLTDAQCTQAFPDLYHEIDRAASYWSARDGTPPISPASISLDWAADGGLQAMIIDQQVYVTFSRGVNHFPHWFQRHRATLLNIQRAVATAPEPVPNIEFSIRINDVVGLDDQHPDTTFWAFSRDVSNPVHDQLWTIPDFNFWVYPEVTGSFQDFQRMALQVGGDFANKIPKVVWRGTTAFNTEVREALLKQSESRAWSSVASVDEGSGSQADRITMEEHCRYKFAVHTEGTTWSGRLKYLLSCNSVIFIHPLRYMTHLYHLLRPEGKDQNYVAVSRDFHDLPGKVSQLLQRPDGAQKIADNAAATFRDRYATPAAQTCYFRKLFQAWRDVSFEPDPYRDVKGEHGTTRRIWRGMTLEEYL